MIPLQKVTLRNEIRNTGTYIKPQQAQNIIAAWQSQYPRAIFSFLYGRHIFDKIFAAPTCAGIRIFNGINDEGKQALVFIGTDAAEKHIFSYELQTAEGSILVDTPIGDLGLPCPPECPLIRDISVGYLWKQPGDNSLDLTQAGGNISRQKAHEMISNWQNQMPDSIYSFLFGREMFEALLAVPDCAGIVVFNGLNQENRQTLVILPVDAKGVNIMQYTVTTPEGIQLCEGLILEGGMPDAAML